MIEVPFSDEERQYLLRLALDRLAEVATMGGPENPNMPLGLVRKLEGVDTVLVAQRGSLPEPVPPLPHTPLPRSPRRRYGRTGKGE